MNHERDRDPVWVQGNALCHRVLQVIADTDPNGEVGLRGRTDELRRARRCWWPK